MTKQKSTKRALLLSAVSLLLCASMFVGTTFAWFTDTVSSGRNIIQSGNLDVELYYALTAEDAQAGNWTKVDAETDIYGYELWEPGHTRIAYFKVANEGSLALKYQLTADVFNETAGKNKLGENGEEFLLSNYLYTKVVEVGATRDEILAFTDGTPLKKSIAMSGERELVAKDTEKEGEKYEDIIGLAIWMPTTVGNEANHNGKDIPTIEFGINLMATQLDAEVDSFGKDYDETADYLNKDENGNWLVTNAAELRYVARQVNGGNSYVNETILLANDVDLKNAEWTPIGTKSNGFKGTFDGQDHTVSNFTVAETEYAGLFGYALNGGNIKNLTVKGATIYATDRAGAVLGAGYTDVVNCHAVDCVITVTPALQADGTYDGGAKAGGVVGQLFEGAGNTLVGCTATNVKVTGYRDIGAVLGMAHNNNTVTDCKAYNSEVAYFYLEDGQVYGDGSVNENIGEVVGRVQSTATVTGSVAENVKLIFRKQAETADELRAVFAEGGSVRVMKSMDLTDPSSGNTYITLDNNVTIYADDGIEMSFGETALINGTGTLTVKGGTLKTGYELCTTGDATLVIDGGEHSFGAFSATGNGSIVVNGGILNCRGTYAGVMGISFAENGSLVVNDGLLNMYQPFNLNANRCDKAYIEINGGTIDLLNGIENLFVVRNIMDKDRESGVLRGSSIRVNGGTFIAHYEIDSAGDATSFIRNGDAPADTNKVLVSNTFNGAADYDCEVTGGTFYGSWQRADNQRYVDGNGGYSDGQFVENSIAGFVADGYQITGDSTNGYVVSAK